MSEIKKLLLNVKEVAELTGLPEEFWVFIAEREQQWDTERFFYAAGSYRITPSYLDAYLSEDLGLLYRKFETETFADYGGAGEKPFREVTATSVQ